MDKNASVPKRFGSITPFVEQGTAERRIGRLVANHDFVKALIRHGSFDEYVLANPSAENQRAFLDVLESWGLDAAIRARVTPLPLVDLPERLATDDFHVFHAGGWEPSCLGSPGCAPPTPGGRGRSPA